jgi:hypothetical protein
MGLTVPSLFTDAEKADVYKASFVTYLVLGNYANKDGYGAVASASGSDASGNYPPSGAIDGDRTELNIGAASAAENGVGKSSWRSNAVPDGTGNVWLEVDLGAQRTVNRMKLYHLEGHGLKSFSLEYWDGVEWVPILVTSASGSSTLGFGDNPFGDTPFGDPSPAPSGSAIGFATTMDLDTVDFDDVTAQLFRVVVYDTEVAGDKANIVELELYRLLDISDRTTSIEIGRQMDYKLKNTMAATVDIGVDNTDRFFSRQYTPTAAEVAAGYINSELRPGLGLIVELGFYGVTVPVFTGTTDFIGTRSRSRQGTISGRDGVKALINKKITTKLKANQDIGDLMVYVLNLANVSTYEIEADTTSIVLDTFFVYDTSVLTVVQQFAQACGDANFKYSEDGIAQFRMLLNSVSQQVTDSSTADFDAGTLVRNVDTGSDTFQGRWWNDSGTWTVTVDSVSEHASFVTTAAAGPLYPYPSPTQVGGDGVWYVKAYPTSGAVYLATFVRGSPFGATRLSIVISTTDVKIAQTNGTSMPFGSLVSVAHAAGPNDVYGFSMDAAGNIVLYINGVNSGTATWNRAVNPITRRTELTTTGAATVSYIYFDDGVTQQYAYDPVLESQVFDLSAALTALGALSANFTLPSTSTINWYVATSADGVTFDPWVAATLGVAVGATLHRYLKYRAALIVATSTIGVGGGGGFTPVVYNVSFGYSTGSGTSKYPISASYTFRYDGSLLDVEQQEADDLGGDSAILNVIKVQSSPRVLTGADTDVTWQGTANVPVLPIAATNPLAVVPGTYTFNPVIAGGMDIANMAGANPAAVAITFAAGGAGSWAITYIHPTTPTLVITVTAPGTITNLQLIGKSYANAETPVVATVSDAESIALYDERTYTLANDYVINSGVALSIAGRILDNFSVPVSYLPRIRLQPTWSLQTGDRCTVVDDNTGISADYIAAEVRHVLTPEEMYTESKLLKIS